MIFDAESKHVRWSMSTLQGKVYPIRNPQEGTPQRLLLRIPEVAESLGIGRTNIYELIATGVLPSIRVGRAVRITDIALQKWVEACDQQDVSVLSFKTYQEEINKVLNHFLSARGFSFWTDFSC